MTQLAPPAPAMQDVADLAAHLDTLGRQHEARVAAELAIPGDARSTKPFKGYPGGKEGAGTLQRIVRVLEGIPHALYVEAFIGGGACLRHKRPALYSMGIDDDQNVIERWERFDWPGLELINACGIEWLAGSIGWLTADTLIYLDPPYMLSTRSPKRLYRRNLTDAEHGQLLDLANAAPCSIAISGYDHPLYREKLAGWNHDEWDSMTRGGIRREHLWWKSAATATSGVATRSAGRDYRERERIKRKTNRWVGKFAKLPAEERTAILARLLKEYQQ